MNHEDISAATAPEGYHPQRISSACCSGERDIWWWLQVSPVSFAFRLGALAITSTSVIWLGSPCSIIHFHAWWCPNGAWEIRLKIANFHPLPCLVLTSRFLTQESRAN